VAGEGPAPSLPQLVKKLDADTIENLAWLGLVGSAALVLGACPWPSFEPNLGLLEGYLFT
jgi:hypothetical protein